MRVLLVLCVAAGCAEPVQDRPGDDQPFGGAPPASTVGASGSTGGSTGSGGSPPANGVCMDYEEALLPPDFAPYQTTCTTTEPYACAEQLGCETRGSISNVTSGLRVSACIRAEDGDDPGKWPAAGGRAGLVLRAVGAEALGELRVGMGAESEGSHGWYRQEGEGAALAWMTAASLSADPPARRGVAVCFDGAEIRGFFWYGEGIRVELVDAVPAGLSRIELGFEAAAPADTDMLGRIELVDVDTFQLGTDGCDVFDPPSCN